MAELDKQLIVWIAEKQPVKIKTDRGEATFLPVKLYKDARKLFVYNRKMKLINICLDHVISIEPTRIYGSFDIRKEQVVHMH
ncbi:MULTISPECIES: hypothetical protein [Parageobacillus]|jgi:hypothetical protein|uniref:Uncharacterized protein n=1 Tax=Parageobacillus thermoglucosidasius TaxID=1426 RepID=A0A1B7KVE8_PARTM|nr:MULTISPECIES: hypothetical protein [Parageobacillus]OAT74017.1 hypothetical protein A7K69_16435 [Parageobacillus thermoglucosidasius]BDG47486.1 hypothetical protein PspKH34_20470 [Parageobacillus sp. KH3-4]